MPVTLAGRLGGMARKRAASRSDTETLGSPITTAPGYSPSILLARATAVQCVISSAMYFPN